jgi:hydroxyacylglutathione hydrolase
MNSLCILPLPAFTDNYIWALSRDGHVAVVDPGEDAPVERYLESSGDRLAAILVTHHHHDHCDGIAALVLRHDVPVFGPAAENIASIDRPRNDGNQCCLPELAIDLDVIGVPGHTLGHVAYYLRGHLFCGDTLFGAGCGRLFEGTAAQLYASLTRLAALPADTAIYCAHEYTTANLRFAAAVEPDSAAVAQRIRDTAALRAAGQPSLPSTLQLELDTNPFLRCNEPAVVAAAAARLGRTPADAAEVFATLREWRNRF